MGSRKIRFCGCPVPMTEKEAQAERFVGIDDRQMKEDMLCLRHDPDIKGQAPCVKGVHTSSAAEKFRGCAVVAAPSGSRQFSFYTELQLKSLKKILIA